MNISIESHEFCKLNEKICVVYQEDMEQNERTFDVYKYVIPICV